MVCCLTTHPGSTPPGSLGKTNVATSTEVSAEATPGVGSSKATSPNDQEGVAGQTLATTAIGADTQNTDTNASVGRKTKNSITSTDNSNPTAANTTTSTTNTGTNHKSGSPSHAVTTTNDINSNTVSANTLSITSTTASSSPSSEPIRDKKAAVTAIPEGVSANEGRGLSVHDVFVQRRKELRARVRELRR